MANTKEVADKYFDKKKYYSNKSPAEVLADYGAEGIPRAIPRTNSKSSLSNNPRTAQDEAMKDMVKNRESFYGYASEKVNTEAQKIAKKQMARRNTPL